VSIHRHAENNYVAERLEESSWLGLSRASKEESFVWVDKSKVDFKNWANEGNSN
jgi:hypothetical protein